MSFLRVVLLVLAVALGAYGVAAGQLLALAGALLLGVLAFVGFGDPPVPAAAAAPSVRGIWKWLQGHPFAPLAVLSTACAAGAAWLAARQELSLASVLLWLGALILILLGALLQDWRGRAPRREKAPKAPRRELILEVALVVLVTGVAFALRAYNLAHFPPFVHGDEGEMGMIALRILEGTDPVPPFRTLWLDHPTLFHYLQAASLALFGQDLVGLRLLSALFGTACVPLLYLVGRIGWGRLTGLTAAWLMAVSHLHIHFSRLGLNNIESVFCMILLVLLLALARERGGRARASARGTPLPLLEETGAIPRAWPARNLALFVGAGLVVGLSQYFYYGSRLLPVVVVPLLLFLALEKRVTLAQVLALALAAIIAFAPLGWHYATHPAPFLNRMRGVGILQEGGVRHTLGPDAVWPDDIPDLLLFQLKRNLGFFVRDGDASAFYLRDIAAFDPLTAVLFWLGLAVALARFRRYHEFAALSWFGLGLLFGGILTNDPPNAPRLILMVPSVYLLGGVFVYRMWKLLSSILNLRLEVVGVPLLLALAVVTLGFNAQTYFQEYARKTGGMAAITVARLMAGQAGEVDAYLMGAPSLYAEYGVIRFVAREARPKNLEKPEDLAGPTEPGKGLLVVALPHRLEDLEKVKERFPGGTATSRYDALGRLLWVAYEVPPGVFGR